MVCGEPTIGFLKRWLELLTVSERYVSKPNAAKKRMVETFLARLNPTD